MICFNDSGGAEPPRDRPTFPEVQSSPLDTSNQFCVCTNAAKTFIMIHTFKMMLTRKQALNLIAWLCLLVCPDLVEVRDLMKRIEKL